MSKETQTEKIKRLEKDLRHVTDCLLNATTTEVGLRRKNLELEKAAQKLCSQVVSVKREALAARDYGYELLNEDRDTHDCTDIEDALSSIINPRQKRI